MRYEELQAFLESTSMSAFVTAQRRLAEEGPGAAYLWATQHSLSAAALREAMRQDEMYKLVTGGAGKDFTFAEIARLQSESQLMRAAERVELTQQTWERFSRAGLANEAMKAAARHLEFEQQLWRSALPRETFADLYNEYQGATSLLQSAEWLDEARAALRSVGAEKRNFREVIEGLQESARTRLEAIRPRTLDELDEKELGIAGIRIAVWLAILGMLFAYMLDRGLHEEISGGVDRLASDIRASDRKQAKAIADLERFVRKSIREELKRQHPPQWGVGHRPAPVFDSVGGRRADTLNPRTVVRELGERGKYLQIEYQSGGQTLWGWTLRKYLQRLAESTEDGEEKE